MFYCGYVGSRKFQYSYIAYPKVHTPLRSTLLMCLRILIFQLHIFVPGSGNAPKFTQTQALTKTHFEIALVKCNLIVEDWT